MGATFGTTVRTARLVREVTLKAVGEALGFSAAYISDIERGFRNPPDERKVRIWAGILELDPEELTMEAALDRNTVELPVSGNQSKGQLAVMLARSWEDLSPEDEAEIRTVLSRLGEKKK